MWAIIGRKLTVFLFLAVMFLIGGAVSASACECFARNDFELEFALSNTVFEGEVIDLDTGARDVSITFRPGKIWKGPKVETVVVKTHIEKQGCGSRFTKGERYLVYADEDGGLRTNRCSRTASIENASDDIRKLNDSGWSGTVKGLRARLIILPSGDPASPFCRVFFEMQNVGNVLGQRRIRFDPDKLALEVTDSSTGRPLAVATGPYDGMRPEWQPTLLPFAGTIRFQISFPGLGYRPTDKTIVDLGPFKSWVIPPNGSYMLSGKLVIPAQKGDHPIMDWSGTLDLPMIRIPKAK